MLKYNLKISSRFEHLRQHIASILKNDVPPEAEPIYMDRNTVYRLTIDKTPIVIKSFQVPNLIDSYMQTVVGKSKSHLSYLNAKRLQQLGFRTPSPVAYGEVLNGNRLLRSYYMTEFISGGDMRGWENNPDNEPLLRAFAAEMARMHNAGILHRDFSPGNILFTGTPALGFNFYHIDLNRMTFDVKSRQKLLSMFGRLSTSRDAIKRLAGYYAQAAGEASLADDALKAYDEYIRQH